MKGCSGKILNLVKLPDKLSPGGLSTQQPHLLPLPPTQAECGPSQDAELLPVLIPLPDVSSPSPAPGAGKPSLTTQAGRGTWGSSTRMGTDQLTWMSAEPARLGRESLVGGPCV